MKSPQIGIEQNTGCYQKSPLRNVEPRTSYATATFRRAFVLIHTPPTFAPGFRSRFRGCPPCFLRFSFSDCSVCPVKCSPTFDATVFSVKHPWNGSSSLCCFLLDKAAAPSSSHWYDQQPPPLSGLASIYIDRSALFVAFVQGSDSETNFPPMSTVPRYFFGYGHSEAGHVATPLASATVIPRHSHRGKPSQQRFFHTPATPKSRRP